MQIPVVEHGIWRVELNIGHGVDPRVSAKHHHVHGVRPVSPMAEVLAQLRLVVIVLQHDHRREKLRQMRTGSQRFPEDRGVDQLALDLEGPAVNQVGPQPEKGFRGGNQVRTIGVRGDHVLRMTA